MWHVPTSCLIRKGDMTQRDSISSNFLKSLKNKTSIDASKGSRSRIGPRLLPLILVIKFVSEFGLSCKLFHGIARVYLVKENRLISIQLEVCIEKQWWLRNSCARTVFMCNKQTFMHIYFLNLFTRHHFVHYIAWHSSWCVVLQGWCSVTTLSTKTVGSIYCICNICK